MVEVDGNLITLAKSGEFDVIVHGCNCFCSQTAGIAYDMNKEFSTGSFPMERKTKMEFWPGEDEPSYVDTNNCGNMNKLGCIEYKKVVYSNRLGHIIGGYSKPKPDHLIEFIVVNAYTQYHPGPDARYNALEICLQKINYTFKGKHIGLPEIGCGIGGLDWEVVKNIIITHMTDVKVTVVHFKP